ncbi:hypothetical protein ACA910_020241 [Epithemia clementina (nom. ined.)]
MGPTFNELGSTHTIGTSHEQYVMSRSVSKVPDLESKETETVAAKESLMIAPQWDCLQRCSTTASPPPWAPRSDSQGTYASIDRLQSFQSNQANLEKVLAFCPHYWRLLQQHLDEK